MSRSRLIFFVIIGAALLLVVTTTVINPQIQSFTSSQSATATVRFAQENTTTIHINYGTEKERWFKDAVAQFEAANPGIDVVLEGQGSMESYQALSLVTDSSASIDGKPVSALWSPASSIQVNLLNAASTNAINRDLATDCKRLVLSPIVMMIWEDRAKVLENHFKDQGGITFSNLFAALDPSGEINGKWENMGGQSRWGLLKLGHTDPARSNSGIVILLALANNYYQRVTPISVSDITNDQFVNWMKTIEDAVTRPLINSTGNFANDVIVKGSAAYDIVLVYEALAIEHYRNAVGKQGQGIRILYPPYNIYSDHPLCVIDHPSLTQSQRKAAVKLQEFLLSAEIQTLALEYGFRPADPQIPVFGTDSAFDSPELKAAGVSNDIGQEFQLPDGNTINQLLTVWRRNFSS